MSIIAKMRKQKCVYWAPASKDGYGKTTYATAVELDCRWDDKIQLVIAPNKQEVTSSASVYVSADVLPSGWLWEGILTDLPSDHTDPEIIAGARQIISMARNPNFKATEYLRTVYLK